MESKSLVMTIKELMDDGKDPLIEMYDTAGKSIVKEMMDFFEIKYDGDCLDFFYMPNRGLGYESPYEKCKARRKKEVSDLLQRLGHGIFV
ncbi:MAG: hypothetical protein KKA79_04205 [Nanoarchaeota archaeon]|nr:hypothetical protein [Nanoarchaeota archaeon]